MSNPRLNESSPAAQFLAREFPVQSPLLAKLQKFIPELSAANEQLQKEQRAADDGISIEHIATNADGKEESSSESSSGEESDNDQSSTDEEGPRVQFDLHLIGSGSENEADSVDDEQKAYKPKEKKKLIEEMD